MPHHTKFRRTQPALLWEPDTVGNDGEKTFVAYREIQVRWEWVTEEILTTFGNPVRIVAEVVATEDIEEGALLWPGSEDEWLGSGSGDQDDQVFQVIRIEKTPTVRGRYFQRELKLSRYGDAPPG